LLWKARRPHPGFRMVPVWMTFDDIFKVTIIQRQITWRWYNIQLYLQWPTNRKSYIIYRTAPFSLTLNDPYPSFKVTPFFDAEYLRNGTHTDLRPTQQCHFEWSWMTLNEWLNKIFNDTKRRAVSLQQLSFLSIGPFIHPFVHCKSEHDILQTNEPISLQLGTNGPRGNGMKWSISGVRRPEFKVIEAVVKFEGLEHYSRPLWSSRFSSSI